MSETYSSFEEDKLLTESWRHYLREPQTDFSTITEEDIKNLNDFIEKDLKMLWEAEGAPKADLQQFSQELKVAAKEMSKIWDELDIDWETARANATALGKQAIEKSATVRKILMQLIDYMSERYAHHLNEKLAKDLISYAWMHIIADIFTFGASEGVGLPSLIFDLAWSHLTGSKGKPGNMPTHELAKKALKKITQMLGSNRDVLEDLTDGSYKALYDNVESFKKLMAASAQAGALQGVQKILKSPRRLQESQIKRFKLIAGVA
tara:strand:+ start:778 stop:1569 length:792 start_codon:yes stop_codon:yes gene_type:complete